MPTRAAFAVATRLGQSPRRSAACEKHDSSLAETLWNCQRLAQLLNLTRELDDPRPNYQRVSCKGRRRVCNWAVGGLAPTV